MTNKVSGSSRCVVALLFGFFVFFAFGFAQSQSNPPPLTPSIKALAFIEDQNKSLSFEEVYQNQTSWQQISSLGISKGYTNSAFWIKADIYAPVSRAIFTALPTFLDNVQFYVSQDLVSRQDQAKFAQTAVAGWLVSQQGDFFSKTQRGLDWRGFSLDLKPQAATANPDQGNTTNKLHTVFIRLETGSTNLIELAVYGERAFQAKVSGELLLFGLVIGGAFSFALTGLFFLAIEARRHFGYYLFFSLSCVLWYLAVNGFISQFLLDAKPMLSSHLLGVGACLVFASVIFLMRALLETRDHAPKTDVFLKWSAIAQLLAAPFALVDLYRFIAQPNTVLAIVQWAALLFVTAKLFKDTRHIRIEVLIVLTGLIALNTAMLLGFLTGVIPSDLTLQIMQAVLFIDLLLLLPMLLIRTEAVKTEIQQAKNSAALAMEKLELQQMAREEQHKWVQMITHELKTPLTVIDTARQSLERLIETDLARERTEKISRATQRLSVLIDSYVLEDEVMAHSQQLQKQAISVNDIVSAIETVLAEDLLARLEIDNSAAELSVYADRDLLILALSNLLVNAAKHGLKGSLVHLRIGAAKLGLAGGVEFVVTNLGQAMATEQQSRLFERYYRFGENAGTGLGLWACREVALSHAGVCDYRQSQNPEGQVQHNFRLVIPAAS